MQISVRWIPWSLLLLAAGALLYRFPLFRIVSLDEAREQRKSDVLRPQDVANELWMDRLPHLMPRAVEASELFAAVRRDRRTARTRYSRALGQGDIHYYFVKGVGRIVLSNEDEEFMGLCLDGEGATVDVRVATGFIFGNAIVDGTRLIDPNDYPNSQDYNRISEQINRIVETRVLPPFRERAVVGARVRFAGCAKIVDEDKDLHPMHIIPVELELLSQGGS